MMPRSENLARTEPASVPGLARIIRRAFRSLLAVCSGYLTIVLLSTLVQEVWLGGVSYAQSDLQTLMLAGIFTPLSGVVGGFVTGFVARRWLLAHALPLGLAIAAETTALYVSGRVDGPLWFEALAGATLIGGLGVGLWIWHWSQTKAGQGELP